MNFDEHIDRNQYPTMKWSRDFLREFFSNEEAIPLSVADMDFQSPQAVVEQMQKRVDHGIFGYENKSEDYFTALESWYQSRHGWQIGRDDLEPCPSILNAVAVLINQHSSEGEGVILQPPVFFEFRMVIRSSGRRMVKNPLQLADGRYQMDFDDLETKAADPRNKVMILCNPHNPVGRVWTKEELVRVASICERHDVFVIADEIHGDFAFPPHRYTPYLTASETSASNAAACISPGKTFNISGLVDALAIIPNEDHRKRFHDFAHRYQTNKNNVLSSAAIEAAYREGASWLEALVAYLQGNVTFMQQFFKENNLPVSIIKPEGTFLTWLDFRELGLDAKALEKFLTQEAGVALAPGYWFGREGAGFARMTIASPRATIRRFLENLSAAVKKLS